MERKRRTYLHRGKLRFKRRVPRKQKKSQNKKWQKQYDNYKNRLIELHGDNWMDYFICGG